MQMDMKQLAKLLVSDSKFKEVERQADEIVRIVFRSNMLNLLEQSLGRPEIAKECKVFREMLQEHGFEAPESDVDLYRELIYPVSLHNLAS